MRCSECRAEGIPGKKFCAECGSPLSNRCSNCGSDNAPDAKFCADCGNALGRYLGSEVAKPSTEALSGIRIAAERITSDATDGERKMITALFADIQGSTALIEHLDPEEGRAIIDPALRIMVDAVRRYEGYVVQTTGDGIFALFGAPLAYEDHPQRAVYAALQMQQGLRELGRSRGALGWSALEARVGVNTGEVLMRMVETGEKTEYTPIGLTAHLASRLQTVATAGSVAVSEPTRELVEGYFELRALGRVAIKGISDPVNMYEVTGLGPLRTHFELSLRRGLTKFVGRQSELEQMKGALEMAQAGCGQIIAVVAEAGTGKSRLFYEFKAMLPAQWKLLEAYSVSYAKASAWLPVLELLRPYFGIQDEDRLTTRREKVQAVFAALDPALNDALPYLFGLLGIVEGTDPLAQMDPQIKLRRTLDAIKRLVLRESLNQPVVVIFEDLQWIDEQTQALLDLLADSSAGARLLLLVNYRPEYHHEWSGKGHYTQLRLDPLSGEAAAAILTALLGEGSELETLKRLIGERTGGNPFFIEETVQALFDEGVLMRSGAVKVTRSLSELRLPPTVQGILAARIDRLSSEQKELLQTLAVIGRESPLGLIREVISTADAPLERILADLRKAEFIYEQPALADAQYIFKHALTQEVAYSSMLIERRRMVHGRIGAALEKLYADRIEDHLADLAHHFARSADTAKAVEYLLKAGQSAVQRFASREALGRLETGLKLLESLPAGPARDEQELTFRVAMLRPLIVARGPATADKELNLKRAQEYAIEPERLQRSSVGFSAACGAIILLSPVLRWPTAWPANFSRWASSETTT